MNLSVTLLKKSRKSDLYSYNWAVHRPLCEEIEQPDSYFLHTVVIMITGN